MQDRVLMHDLDGTVVVVDRKDMRILLTLTVLSLALHSRVMAQPPQAPNPPKVGPVLEARDALDEVNAARKRRGLRPFMRDENYTQAAIKVAEFRAKMFIKGHTQNDFAFLPKGVGASAAGCGALTPDWGWGSCCTYDNYTWAGAAVITGADGRRYMHIYVR